MSVAKTWNLVGTFDSQDIPILSGHILCAQSAYVTCGFLSGQSWSWPFSKYTCKIQYTPVILRSKYSKPWFSQQEGLFVFCLVWFVFLVNLNVEIIRAGNETTSPYWCCRATVVKLTGCINQPFRDVALFSPHLSGSGLFRLHLGHLCHLRQRAGRWSHQTRFSRTSFFTPVSSDWNIEWTF